MHLSLYSSMRAWPPGTLHEHTQGIVRDSKVKLHAGVPGVLDYGLELRFWVVIEIIVSLTLTITLITTLTMI